jgi:hypothetical protein
MRATNKPFHIEKRWVYEAYQAIRSNGKAAGVDGQTLEQFEADLSGNLYKIWNRLCQEPRKGGTVLEMGVGPLRSAYRGGSQTAGCC